MKKLKLAAFIIIFHGLIEILSIFSLLPFVISTNSKTKMPEFASFIIPYFKENMNLMTIMSVIYGIMRIIGAIGLLKNRMWGLALCIINCVVTMILMIFMLPAGIMDGIFACSALVLLLMGYFDKKEI